MSYLFMAAFAVWIAFYYSARLSETFCNCLLCIINPLHEIPYLLSSLENFAFTKCEQNSTRNSSQVSNFQNKKKLILRENGCSF